MNEVIDRFFGKISSYNLFNNLFPGAIFCYFLRTVCKTNLLTDNILENLIVYYFIGVVLGRIGSLVIEPLMRIMKIKKEPLLKFSSYSDYVKVNKEDSLLETLSETNNMYRTLLTCFICLLLYKICMSVEIQQFLSSLSFTCNKQELFLLIVLVIIFGFSYVKQTAYIKNRVDAFIKEKDN